MKDFMFYSPVALFFGDNCLEKNKHIYCAAGKKAFILTSRFAGNCRNYALEDVRGILAAAGIDTFVFDKAEENPTVESVAAVTEELRRYQPDFIFAVGGGSALDTAKAANVLLGHAPEEDAYDVFYGCGAQPVFSQGKLPMYAVPTTAGSGSDTCGCAILTRSNPHTKLSMLQKSNFTAAFLDARYIMDSPLGLIDSGVLDALAHGVESHLSVRNHLGSEMFSEFGFRLFSEFKDNLLHNTLTKEDYEKMLIAASMQGSVLLLTSTSIPHGLGYPLSINKGLNHGFSSTITLGEYMRSFKDQTEPNRVARMCGFADEHEFAWYVDQLIARNVHLEVTEAEIDQWSAEFMTSEKRLQNHPEPISREDIKDIYMRSLKRYLIG